MVRCWQWHGYLSGARCRLAYGPADVTATQSLASVKSRLVLPFWYRLTWVVLDIGPLNGCVCKVLTSEALGLDLNKARDDGVLGWQWHQVDHMQTICTLLHQTTTPTQSRVKSRQKASNNSIAWTANSRLFLTANYVRYNLLYKLWCIKYHCRDLL